MLITVDLSDLLTRASGVFPHLIISRHAKMLNVNANQDNCRISSSIDLYHSTFRVDKRLIAALNIVLIITYFVNHEKNRPIDASSSSSIP